MGNTQNKSSLRKSHSVPDTQRLAADAPVFDKQKSVSQLRLNNVNDKAAKPGKTGKKNKQQNEDLPQINPAEATFLPEFPLRGDLEELEFDILDVIARGAFGNVIKVLRDDQKQFYAVKVLDKSQIIEEGAIRQCKDEATIQSMAGQHPFVVKAHEYWQSKRSLYIVLDYVPHGDMFTLWTFHGAFPEKLVQLYIAEMAMVIDFLHNASVIYRDIKMENILFNAKGHIQLTDFGLAKWLQGGEQTRTVCGTLQYMAPEVLSVYPYSHSADWWSLGILMYAMLAGRYPVDGVDTHTRMAQRVFECDFLLPSHISDSAQDVINRVLTKSPHKRLCDVDSFQDLEFFQDIFFSDLIEHKLNPVEVVPEDFFPMTGQSWAPQELTNEEQGHFDQFDDTLTDEPHDHHINRRTSHHHAEPVGRLRLSHPYNQHSPQEYGGQHTPHNEHYPRNWAPDHEQENSPHDPYMPDRPYNLQSNQLPQRRSVPDFQTTSNSLNKTGMDSVIARNPSLRNDRGVEMPVPNNKNRHPGILENRQNSMSKVQYNNRNSILSQSGQDGRSNLVPQLGLDTRGNVPSSGYGGNSNLPQSMYNERSNGISQPWHDGKMNGTQSGMDGRNNASESGNFDRGSGVPQLGYEGQRNSVSQGSNIVRNMERVDSLYEAGHRSSISQNRNSYGENTNSQNVARTTGTGGTNNGNRPTSATSISTWNSSSALNTNRLSSGPEYKSVESAPTVTLKTPNPSQARYNQTPGYNSQTSIGRTTQPGHIALNNTTNNQSNGVNLSMPNVSYQTQTSDSRISSAGTGGPGQSKNSDLGYRVLEAPPTLSFPAAQIRLQQDPGLSQNRGDLQRFPSTTSTDSRPSVSSSTNMTYANSNYQRIEQAPITLNSAQHLIQAPQRPSIPTKPTPLQKPNVGPKPAVPVKPIPAPRQSLRTNIKNGAQLNTGSHPSLNQDLTNPSLNSQYPSSSMPIYTQSPNNSSLSSQPHPFMPSRTQGPNIPSFNNQYPSSSMPNHTQVPTNPSFNSISHNIQATSYVEETDIDAESVDLNQDWNSQNLQPDHQIRVTSATTNNTNSSRPDSLTRTHSIDDHNFQWKLPAGTTPSFV